MKENVGVRPLPEVQRHAAAHIEDIVPFVQILDVPVPQLGVRVVDLLREIDAPALVEKVIAVPKISLGRVPQRSVCRRSRRAEQLVEVPTIVSYSSQQQRTAKQTIDIPVPHGRGDRDRGGGGGLRGLRPGQNSTALVEQNVDIPVPHGRSGRVGHGGLQGFSQGQASTVFRGADHVDNPVPQGRGGFGGPQGFLPSSSGASSSHSPGAVDEAFTVVFRTFPQIKKSAGLGPHSGSELGADFNPWTPAAYAESMVIDDDESEAESESEVEVGEGAATRFAVGFRPLRVCTRFLEHQMGRPVWGCLCR